MISFSMYLGSLGLRHVDNKVQIHSFLDTKIKTVEEDPDGKWITTWNDYLSRLKYFFRWLHNCESVNHSIADISEWVTPDFVHI
jgi:hypothetical protein